MKLSKKEVEHIANLARLRLRDEEKEKYSEQLSAILDYVEKMNKVDTNNVEPTSQVTGLKNVMREDKIKESGIHEELVKTAPESYADQIKVPDILNK